jgi:hypothetical protein
MPYHRLELGQTVTMPSPIAPAEPYMIVRLLPPVGDEPLYRVRSAIDGEEKVLPEGQIGVHRSPRLVELRAIFFGANSSWRGAPQVSLAAVDTPGK